VLAGQPGAEPCLRAAQILAVLAGRHWTSACGRSVLGVACGPPARHACYTSLLTFVCMHVGLYVCMCMSVYLYAFVYMSFVKVHEHTSMHILPLSLTYTDTFCIHRFFK